ncbi:hypothetical protein [Flavobacterium sp.]|uniref:hypothetical protein n=1 Tax=Flavobacterium sp. TaxID=239 RepID=UPI002607E701|nr:hypothetical protein [Flavobacterium sp.]
MNKEIFNFDDNRVKENIVYKDKIVKKIKHCMKYLENHLPVNELDKDNKFDFNKIKFDEGKNYDWFFLNNEKVTILVRQYRCHFTFFTMNKHEVDSYFNKLAIFTLHDDSEKMEDNLSDEYCDNNFKTLEEVLPQLVDIIAEQKVGGMWNPLSFVRPKFTEVKIAFVGEESVHSLDTLIFACDELFHMYLMKFAENETLAKLKDLKAGDAFGKYYTIASVSLDLKEGYYHGVGLKKYRNNDETKKEDWSDVYSLTRYEYETLFFANSKDDVEKFLFANHDKVFGETFTKDIMIMAQFTNKYIKMMHELFIAEGNEIDIKVFVSFMPEHFVDFLEISYRVNLTKL